MEYSLVGSIVVGPSVFVCDVVNKGISGEDVAMSVAKLVDNCDEGNTVVR